MSAITDVGGIRVGQHQRIDADATLGAGWASGTTVVLTPPGTVGAVDGRGGAPGTRETDLLDPINSVRHVDAVVLQRRQRVRARCGRRGDALARGARAAGWRWRAAWCRSCPPRWSTTCPSVAGNAGRPPSSATPPPRVAGAEVALGTVGAGAGARVGVLKGGVGTASVTLDSGVTVGAIVVVNAAGEVRRHATGLPWQADQIEEFGLIASARRPDRRLRRQARRVQPAEHHDRGRRHRRGDEPGRVPPRRRRRP